MGFVKVYHYLRQQVHFDYAWLVLRFREQDGVGFVLHRGNVFLATIVAAVGYKDDGVFHSRLL